MKKKLGIVDTTFAIIDMYKFAKKAISDFSENIEIIRYTVPGIKDIAVASKILFEKYNCDIVLALGMPGPKEIDKQCANQASNGIINTQLLVNKHILEVFVHMDETNNKKELYEVTKNRTYKHTINAIKLLKGKNELSKNAGQGIRQGFDDEGPIRG
ncbi:MAG: riboflavin synthase [Nanoarchaeota archaeon]